MAQEELDPRKHNSEECVNPQCDICKYKKPFDFPREITEAYKNGQLIIFAGAGISTERREIFPVSFSNEIKIQLGIPKEEKIKFSTLMTKYCNLTGSKKELFTDIKQRIDYVTSFPELFFRATEFHRELSVIPHLDEVFTTNWDDFFEKECGSTPIVTGQDFALFQDISGRKIFKIHGSISNYSSIIATEEDYRKCYRQMQKGIIGAVLKNLLVTKTIVFVGYSLGDEDFQKIYNLLKKDTNGIMPSSYIVTLDENAETKIRLLKMNTLPINTDSSYFIHEFKKKLVEEKLMLPETNFEGINEKLEKVITEHHKLSLLDLNKYPDSIYSLAYQDGLMHAFERILLKMNTGEYSCMTHLSNTITDYDKIIKDKLHQKNYWDVAYFRGYQNGLIYLFTTKDRESIPLYYLFGENDVLTFEDFFKFQKNASKKHKTAHQKAVSLIKKIKPKETVMHHRPFL